MSNVTVREERPPGAAGGSPGPSEEVWDRGLIPSGFYVRHGKRALDVLIATVALLFAAVPMTGIAIWLRLVQGRPVLFVQRRIGRWGRPFALLKFRTMFVRSTEDTTVTVAGDQRVTSLGRVLRRLKLDELPQLFNVVKGDMSFVGPRPDVPGFYDLLEGEDRVLLALRPGITGPATLVFRREEEMLEGAVQPDAVNRERIFPAKVRLNRDYLSRVSLSGDLCWMISTVLPSRMLTRVRLEAGSTVGEAQQRILVQVREPTSQSSSQRESKQTRGAL